MTINYKKQICQGGKRSLLSDNTTKIAYYSYNIR